MRFSTALLFCSALLYAAATPIASEVLACAAPTLVSPTFQEIIVLPDNPNARLTIQARSNDCDSLRVLITDLQGGEPTDVTFNRQGYSPVFFTVFDFELAIGKYEISVFAVDSTGIRPSSAASSDPPRPFRYAPQKCPIPSFAPDLAGKVFRSDPPNFEIVISSDDCEGFQLEVYADNGNYGYDFGQRETYMPRVGYNGGSATVTSRIPLSPGGYFAQLRVNGEPDRLDSEIIGPVRFVVGTAACPPPGISRPTPGESFQIVSGNTYPVPFVVSTTTECSDVAYTITDSRGTVTLQNTQRSAPYEGTVDTSVGAYTLSLVASKPNDPGSASTVTTRSYSVAAAAPVGDCDAAQLTSPANNGRIAFPDGAFTYVATYGNCRDLKLYLNGQYSGLGGVAKEGGEDSLPGQLNPGTYRAYITADDTNTPARRQSTGPTTTFYVDDTRLACDAPTITDPNNSAGPALVEPTPRVSGTTTPQIHCTNVQIFARPFGTQNDMPIGSGSRMADNTFAIVSSTLQPGTYELYAISTNANGGTISPISNLVKVIVGPAQPISSITLRRRKLFCARDQDECTQMNARGKQFLICVPDLDTNLERCGSCGGPDCTTLPYVDDVACVQGRCRVSSCEEGYIVWNNTCIAKRDDVFHIQSMRRRSAV